MNQPLREPLEQLHTELDKANADASHTSLSALQNGTKTTLDHTDPQAKLAEDTGFRTRLETAVEEFEVSHPDVARAARDVLAVLTANGL